jgi:hypothetical protein
MLAYVVGPVCIYYEITFRKKFSPMPSDILLLIKTNYGTKRTPYFRVAIPYNALTLFLVPDWGMKLALATGCHIGPPSS